MERTAARQRIASEQKRFPPPKSADGRDRAAAILELLAAFLPPELNAVAARDDLVAGEVGEIHPDVRTAYPQNGYSIEFTTGMMLFTELVARYCAGTFVEGASGSPALDLDAVKSLFEAVMKTYLAQTRTVWKVFQPKFEETDVRISAAAAEFRDGLLESSRVFMLAHEVGHVAIATGVRARVTDNEEIDADTIGLSYALPAAAASHHWRIAIAGAGLAIRMYVSLQAFGLRLSSAYPPQNERLALLEKRLRALLGSDQRADEFSTVMVAILDLMDDLDARIKGETAVMRYTESRVRIGLLARLIEVASGRLSVDAFVAMIDPYAIGSSAEALAGAFNSLHDYYWDWVDLRKYFFAPHYLEERTMFDQQRLVAMSEALRAVAAAMPGKYRSLIRA